MGRHNVIALPDGHFAIRSDAVGLTTVAAGKLEASVTGVEYQGTHVSVTARTVGDQDVTALMADSLFFEQPKTPGDRVGLLASNRPHHGGIGNHSGKLGRFYMGHISGSIARARFETPAEKTVPPPAEFCR